MATRDGSGGELSGSIRTVPVKYSAGPLPEGCEPLRLISIIFIYDIPFNNARLFKFTNLSHNKRGMQQRRLAPERRTSPVGFIAIQYPQHFEPALIVCRFL